MRLQHRLALAECLSQLGIPKEKLGQARLNAVVVAEFGKERPDLSVALPVIMRRLLG